MASSFMERCRIQHSKQVKWSIFFAMFFSISAFAQQPSQSPTPETVWTWSKSCAGTQRLGITVRLDGKTLYRGVLSICRAERDGEDGKASFHFVGGHTFQGEYRTRSKDAIDGDIWQAAGEKDALVLGLSFQDKRRVLLNTLHIARSDKQESSELDKGLFVTTYPIPVH